MVDRKKTASLVVAALVIAVVATVGAVTIYRQQIAPFRIPVVTVGGKSVTMDHFLKRVRMSGRQPTEMA